MKEEEGEEEKKERIDGNQLNDITMKRICSLYFENFFLSVSFNFKKKKDTF